MKAGRCERRRSELTERSEVNESFNIIIVDFRGALYDAKFGARLGKSSGGVGT